MNLKQNMFMEICLKIIFFYLIYIVCIFLDLFFEQFASCLVNIVTESVLDLFFICFV